MGRNVYHAILDPYTRIRIPISWNNAKARSYNLKSFSPHK
jgi:hypothetical protein